MNLNKTQSKYPIYASVSEPFLPRGTLSQLYQYLVATLDAKQGLMGNKSDNW